MKKLLLLGVVGMSSIMQANNTFSCQGSKDDSFVKRGFNVDINQDGRAVNTFLYTSLNLGLRHYGVHEAVQARIEGKVSNWYARCAAVHLTRAGIDSATMAAISLLVNRRGTYTLETAGKRLGATTAVNTALCVVEELAQKNSTAKSVVESEVYQSFVRPGLQFFGTSVLLNLLNSASGTNQTP